MKYVILALVMFLGMNILGDDEDIIRDIPVLIKEINKATSNRWKISASRFTFSLVSKKQFLGKNPTYCGPKIRENTPQNYNLIFSFTEKIDPDKYKLTRQEYQNKYDSLLKKATSMMKTEHMKGDWVFTPESEEDWKVVLQFECAEYKLNNMPDYYYKGVGLEYRRYWYYVPKNKESKVYKTIMKDVAAIFKLLKKYQEF
jgi:hypothetical protein